MNAELIQLLSKIDPKIKDSIIKILESEYRQLPKNEVLTPEQKAKIKEEEAQSRLESIERNKKYQAQNIILEYAIVACDFDLKIPKTRLQKYYPDLFNKLKIAPLNYKIGDKIEVVVNEYIWLSEEDFTPSVYDKLAAINDMLDHPVYYAKANIYADRSEEFQVKDSLEFVSFKSDAEQRQDFESAKKEFEFVLANYYMPAFFNLKTGKTKTFTIEFLGSVVDQNVGQFKLV